MPDGGRVSAIAVSPANTAVIMSGTDKGDIVRSQASDTSVLQQSARPRNGWVTSIAFDPRNDGTVYATYGNFGGAHLYRSTDGGATWQTLDGSGVDALPDIPVHSIVVDPDDSLRLYLATDLGVMTSIDGGRTWLREETGFGPAVTMWLQIVKVADGPKYLFAFTHGRGAWRVRLP
jgi:WD40 repeat protein